MSRCRSVGVSPEVLDAMITSAAAWRLTSANIRCFKRQLLGNVFLDEIGRCAIVRMSVVKDSLPLGGSGANVRRASAGSALATAPRIHSSISGLTSAAITSMPKCSARAAQPPPMTPVPNSPRVFTSRMIHLAARKFYYVTIII